MEFLQILGGMCYLLNKIFLWLSEKSNENYARQWRIASWVVYLMGLPPWIIILVSKRAWIAALLEASGGPSMLLGMILAIRKSNKNPPKLLNQIAVWSIPIGLSYSIYDYGGMMTLNQHLEAGLAVGFLVGTYLLARKNPNGYLWYLIMHICCAWLVWNQGFPWLCAQQWISMFFIADAWRISKKR